KLKNIEDDKEVRNYIFNMLHMDAGISDLQIQREIISKFGEKYGGMSPNDWRHIIEAYTPMVRDAAKQKVMEVNMNQYGMAADRNGL
ncbi:MAG: hypothetical protein J6M40_02180, partial [Prevotella sp.]|nr:hypothetical protein [Prevotella sp.]